MDWGTGDPSGNGPTMGALVKVDGALSPAVGRRATTGWLAIAAVSFFSHEVML